ncbi:hypothetical protein BGW41_004633 [Actinomortierella wolfii]|nr:hypothetical protein BGW41_004633 [Actinomortierella wolfii]
MVSQQNYTPGMRPLSKATSRRAKPHPHPFFQGNYYPVFEETPGDDGIACEIISGTIPHELEGSMYIRTGQNAFEPPPEGTPHHLFDETGMLHGIYFVLDHTTGRVCPRYYNRYVRSEILEKDSVDESLMVSIGVFFGCWLSTLETIFYLCQRLWRWCKKGLNNVGNGNTAVTFHNARVLTLHEAGLPVEVTIPQLTTVGTFYFQEDGEPVPKSWPIVDTFTAHPKIDPVTGDMIAFGFLDLPNIFDPLHLVQGKPILTFRKELPSRFGIIPREYNAARDKDKVFWFETDSCFIYHTATAWDEVETSGNVVAVCMTACRSNRPNIYLNQHEPHPEDGRLGGGPTMEEFTREKIPPGSGRLEDQDPDGHYLTYFRFDLMTHRMYTMTLNPLNLEFPMIHPDFLTRPDQRFVYLATFSDSEMGVAPRPTGLTKIDTLAVIEKGLAKHKQKLQDHLNEHQRTAACDSSKKNKKRQAKQSTIFSSQKEHHLELGIEELAKVAQETSWTFYHGEKIFGGECSFVPRSGRLMGSRAKAEDEDDGYLLVFVYDEAQLDDQGLELEGIQQYSELWILDAKKMGGTNDEVVVCKIRVPRRIPYGFHGLWIDKAGVEANIKRRSAVPM